LSLYALGYGNCGISCLMPSLLGAAWETKVVKVLSCLYRDDGLRCCYPRKELSGWTVFVKIERTFICAGGKPVAMNRDALVGEVRWWVQM